MNSHISKSVHELKTEIWQRRHELGISNFNPVDLLDPRIAATVLGWELEEVPSIQIGRRMNICASLEWLIHSAG